MMKRMTDCSPIGLSDAVLPSLDIVSGTASDKQILDTKTIVDRCARQSNQNSEKMVGFFQAAAWLREVASGSGNSSYDVRQGGWPRTATPRSGLAAWPFDRMHL